MSLRQKIDQLEKQIKKFITATPVLDLEEIQHKEKVSALWNMPKFPVGTPEEENKLQRFARTLITILMKRENPEQPHYPQVWALALADRYNIKLSEYAVNEKHAEMLEAYQG